jgi:O-antigen/teichoic acid export membrane protein
VEANLDSLVVARFLGTTPLGFYQVACQISTIPAAQLGTQVSGVMFPAFSRMQDSPAVKPTFFTMLTVISSLALPMCAFVYAFATPLVALGLGAKWMSIVPLVQLLTIAGALKALTVAISPLFLGLGEPRRPVTAALLRIASMAVLLAVCLPGFGVRGVAIAAAGSAGCAFLYLLVCALRLLDGTLVDVLLAWRYGVLGSVAPIAASVFISGLDSEIMLGLATCLGIAYLGVLYRAVLPHFREAIAC